jgi:hypothetical protein
MRVILATILFAAAMFVDVRFAPARSLDAERPWCIIRNTGKATWFCYPTRALCRRYGEVPNTGFFCVPYPVWSGRGGVPATGNAELPRLLRAITDMCSDATLCLPCVERGAFTVVLTDLLRAG